VCMFRHCVRRVARGRQSLRGFVSIARPSVAVMSRSFCSCTGRTVASRTTQGDLMSDCPQFELTCRRFEQLRKVEATELWRRSYSESCLVLGGRLEGLRGVSFRASCRLCGGQRTCSLECGCGLPCCCFGGSDRNCWW
jgi:hypothetical protein